uniref:Transcriptional activator protein Pur-alpha n=1 Tax=Acrobeloides nanus TaxID=290746 RepID=A0A914CWC7_9BILA
MSDSGSETGGNRGDRNQGEELATRTISIQAKRFYLDVKQNNRGRFIKFAEVGGGGRKNRIFMNMLASQTLRDHLNKFIDVINGLGDETDASEGGVLHSETIVSEKRRYFLDLKENNRGRFLRISQTFLPMGPRYQIAIPAQGISQLRDVLTELLDAYAEGYLNEPAPVELPESRHMRADNGKNIYFDPGHNERGDFLRISEVKLMSGARSSVTIAMRNLPQFRDILTDIIAKMEELKTAAGEPKKEDAGKS